MRNSGYHLRSLVLLLPLALAACGYAEWPPRQQVPENINRASSGNGTFAGASAVIVGKGDTVYALSRRHRVPMRAIIEANNLRAPFTLRVGQRIVLPRGKIHLVKKGDTLSQIAVNYDVDAYEVARLNGLRPPYIIRVGEPLTLPVNAASTTRTVAVSPNAQKRVSSAPKTVKSKPQKPPAWASPPKPKQTTKTSTPQAKPVRVPPPPPKSGSGFIWPVNGKVISSFGGKAKGLRNDGVNIQAGRGTTVVAAENGVVAYAGNELRGFGNLLLIKHAGGWVTAYAHNDRLLVKRGQKLKRGQKIATVGSTGNVATPQLHFEIRKGKTARDPKKYLRGRA
jgi:murein DD-endopeptidase MepM/ murein hydrolase activator NlpD